MKDNGFTLIEILVVVVILGILAAITLPRFSNAASAARASMLADDLRTIRMQLGVFEGQHGIPAGYPNCDPNSAPTEAAFLAYMTMASKATGETAPPGTAGFPFGPYLRTMPQNPINGNSSVQIVPDGAAFPAAADDSHGWVYQPQTGIFKADCKGSDENGVAYFDY